MSRRLFPYLGLLALLGLIVAGLWPEPAPVETARTLFGPLRSTINEEGKTRIKQRFLISAPVAGLLRRIPYKAGAPVAAHETLLAVIDPLPPEMLDPRARSIALAARDAARANLERAQAAHKFAASELRRVEALARAQTVSVQELETAQWRETASIKELGASESALRQAEAQLAEFNLFTLAPGSAQPLISTGAVQVVAPSSGRVLRVYEESARVVAAGMPLVEIGDPADLEAVIEVLSRDGAALAPGVKVELLQWGGGRPLDAVVRLVEPAAFTKISALGVEEQRVNVIADIITPPAQRASLGDQFRIEGSIVTWETNRVLKIPTGAVFRRGQQTAVFKLKEKRAELAMIEAGHNSGTEVEVLSGLAENDLVILYPGDRIKPGQRVVPIQVGSNR